MDTGSNPSLAVCNRADMYETGEGRFVCILLQCEGEKWDNIIQIGNLEIERYKKRCRYMKRSIRK
jgi:hypothetical protein